LDLPTFIFLRKPLPTMLALSFLGSCIISLIWYTILVLIWFIVIALFVIWWNQEFLLYQPTFANGSGEGRQTPFNPKGIRIPSEMQLPFHDVFLDTEDGAEVNGWLITEKPPGGESTDTSEIPDRPCILYLHGNAGNIGHRLPGLREMYYKLKCDIFIIDYRGYGNSSGSPSEYGLIRDAKAALKYLSERAPVDNKNIIVFGRSLGGAVAIALTAKYPNKIKALVVENTFTRIDDMASVLFGRITKIKNADRILPFLYFYISNPWRSINRIPKVTRPILFFSGLKDQLIPPEQMQALYDAATGTKLKMMHKVPEGDHNNTVDKGGHEYYERFREFLEIVEQKL